MTRDEALGIVKYLADAYRTEITEGTVLVWLDHLRGVNTNVGMQAAHELAAASQFMPHPSEFLQHARRIARRVGEQQQALPESTGPATGRQRALAHVADLRAVLAAASPRPVASPAPNTKPERSSTTGSLPRCPYCFVDDDGNAGCTGGIARQRRPPEADRAAPTPPPADPS